jgi:hypothetical protein
VAKSSDEEKHNHYPLEIRYKKGDSLQRHQLFEEGDSTPYSSNGYLSVVLTVTELAKHTSTHGDYEMFQNSEAYFFGRAKTPDAFHASPYESIKSHRFSIFGTNRSYTEIGFTVGQLEPGEKKPCVELLACKRRDEDGVESVYFGDYKEEFISVHCRLLKKDIEFFEQQIYKSKNPEITLRFTVRDECGLYTRWSPTAFEGLTIKALLSREDVTHKGNLPKEIVALSLPSMSDFGEIKFHEFELTLNDKIIKTDTDSLDETGAFFDNEDEVERPDNHLPLEIETPIASRDAVEPSVHRFSEGAGKQQSVLEIIRRLVLFVCFLLIAIPFGFGCIVLLRDNGADTDFAIGIMVVSVIVGAALKGVIDWIFLRVR